MCGICGVFYWSKASQSVDAVVLERMRDTMTHRGPDGSGLWMSSDRRVGQQCSSRVSRFWPMDLRD